jgi:hypothetical protein
MRASVQSFVTLLLAVIVGFCVEGASAQDIYVAYAGKDKKVKNALTDILSKDLQIKTYNVDLLGIADYSGVQKAAAKLSRAKVVVLLHDGPSDMLKGSTIDAEVVIVNSLKRSVKSRAGALYVLGKTSDTSRISSDMNRVDISSKKDLIDRSEMKPGDVFVVDETSISMNEVAAIIATSLSEAS